MKEISSIIIPKGTKVIVCDSMGKKYKAIISKKYYAWIGHYDNKHAIKYLENIEEIIPVYLTPNIGNYIIWSSCFGCGNNNALIISQVASKYPNNNKDQVVVHNLQPLRKKKLTVFPPKSTVHLGRIKEVFKTKEELTEKYFAEVL